VRVDETVQFGADGPGIRQALQRVGSGPITLESQQPLDPAVIERVRKKLSAQAGRDIVLEVRINPRLAAGASLVFGTELKIDLDPVRKLLEELDSQLRVRVLPEAPSLEETADHVSALIQHAAPRLRLQDISDQGTVMQVGDGVAVVRGLRGVGSQEVVRFECGVPGIAFNLLDDAVGCLILGPEDRIQEGSTVQRTGEALGVPVGAGLIGRVVNALGQAMDGGGPIRCDRLRSIEALSPGVVQRLPVTESLHSGIKIIDALVPLGRGQRELVLGDRKIGKSTIALDVILSQKDSDVTCVYAAIGQKASAIAGVVDLLQQRGAMDYTVVVAALSSDSPGFRYVVPYAACAIAEEFMRSGQHALVVYDDLSKHAVTYREISALLKRPIGREAYPGDIFYVHSRLLERAARLREDLGGGSLTAIPIVETLAGDISALIPTNTISICDGQIFLDTALFNEGSRPAMDVGLSVSRVGGMAQTPAMRKVAGRLRIDLAQYHEMARFVKFGAEVDEATLQQLKRGEREIELLKQDAHQPLPVEKEIVTLYAAVNGFTDDIPVEQLRRFEEGLHAVLDADHSDLLATIRSSGDLSTETESRLAQALVSFRDVFKQGLSTASKVSG
jgi:F-type H+-transporting ATPase subunit alpha